MTRRLGALAGSATLAGVVLGCTASPEPPRDVILAVPPPSIALIVPRPRPERSPGGRFEQQVFAALEGVCERAWWVEDGDLRVGCKQCPRMPWASPEEATEAPPAAIAHADPALRVLRKFAARLMGNAGPEIVLSYEGCQPEEAGHVGTLVIDAEKQGILRDHSSFELLACRAAPRDEREVLVCIGHEDAWRLRRRDGTKVRTVGVYDGIESRRIGDGGFTEVITWHPMRLFEHNAEYFCGGRSRLPGIVLRFGDVSGMSVTGDLVTFTGTFAKRTPTDAYRQACEDGADLGAVLQAAPFSLDFELRDGKLVATPSAERWLAAAR